MRLQKNTFFSKQTEMPLSYFTELDETAILNLQWCIIKDMPRKILHFLFQVQRHSFPGCAWQDPLLRQWLWSNGLQFFKTKTFSNTTPAYVSPIPDLKAHDNQSQAAPTTCKLHPDASFPTHTRQQLCFSRARILCQCSDLCLWHGVHNYFSQHAPKEVQFSRVLNFPQGLNITEGEWSNDELVLLLSFENI